MNILVHTSFIGNTGYNNHSRSFFTALNKFHNVKVRNYTVGETWSHYHSKCHDKEPYMTNEMRGMLILQSLHNPNNTVTDYPLYDYDGSFKPDVNIILNDVNHRYFYDNYEGYTIGYNVWETTEYPQDFFNQILKFDEFWVPSEWQKNNLIKQGYPEHKIFVVPEGVDGNTFSPEPIDKKEFFTFLLFGRWEYRKSTKEIIETFAKTFDESEPVKLVVSADNPYATDGLGATEDRLKHFNINHKNIEVVHFPSRQEYVNYLKQGNVFLSCARSEGWNLPLCVPENKKILCNNKFISIQNVKENDLVYTHTGKKQKVLKTFKRQYNGEIINIQLYNDYDKLSLTPEHPVYVIKRKRFITKKDKFKLLHGLTPEWICAKDIEKGDIVIRTTINQEYYENEIIDLSIIDDRLKYDENNVWYNTGYNGKGELKKYSRFVNLHDLSFLFGWYIAEGSNGKNRLEFCLNAKKEIPIGEKIISEIKKYFGVDGYLKIKENRLNVRFDSVLLCKFFDYFCSSLSYNKKIPEKILFGPNHILSELIDNMVLGDGHTNNKNFVSYTTVSEILGRQLLFANQKLGIKTSIQINKRTNRETRLTYVLSWNKDILLIRHSNKSWFVNNGLAILVRNVQKEIYDGFVYNIEVENDNSYLLSNATVHNCEAMACGTPSIYSNWGGQLEFAKGLGIPVKTLHEVPASNQESHFVGNYIQPDYNDLSIKMRYSYEEYHIERVKAMKESLHIREKFNWDKIAEKVSDRLNKLSIEEKTDWVFVTTGNEKYMPVIEKLVQSINEFSKHKIIVYGVDCDVSFDSPCLIKKRLSVPYHSEHDKWYWKQYTCIESIKEGYKHYVWIDGDVIVNYNIDTIEKYFEGVYQYPLSDIHVQEEFVGFYDNGKSQLFNERLCELYSVNKIHGTPYDHACLYIYDESCQWFFERIIEIYKETPLDEYKKYLLWNDEGIHNLLKWKHNSVKKLPLSNFDVSGYDGDNGDMKSQLKDFYTFWEKEGPYNFGRIYGYQYIPKDKSQILYFHGNKNSDVSDKMIEYIKLKRDNNLYKSEYFWSIDGELKNLGTIKNTQGGVMDIANQYGWDYAIYHEIYNLQDYYHNRIKRIENGDIVVDLGGNIGIFNRWAYSQGAGLVISFEPDKRYFKILSKNSDPRSLLFNSAMSDSISTTNIFESHHLGGSNIFVSNTTNIVNYPVRTYTLDYLFETKLIDRIDFLKIDTEGAEQLIMKGISDENLMKVKNISMEYHHAHLGFDETLRTNMIQRLNRLGFNSYLLFLGTNNQLQMLYFWR